MFGNDNNQPQAQGSNNFSLDNFVPPSAPQPSTPPAQDLSTPELPSNGTPDPDPAPAPSTPVTPATTSNDDSAPSDDLLDLKQQALHQLSPLVDQLDQTPEEKFRTTMMMIQASDDQALLKTAYDAAQAITDEKARAQALLGVVNEINYFTQHHDQ